ncbi:MAG: ABC transporter ATP-binding protein [Firmicutes bacterium]|nr:ABC transporter ATP-binding protein [Bacillota bacterium]
MTLLTVENMSKNFSGLKAVTDLSLTVEEGQICGLIGPNGAGKTTTFNLITGFLPVSAGKIFFDKTEITGLESHKICDIGLTRTFQHAQPFRGLSVHDNVLTGSFLRNKKRKDAEKITDDALDMVKMYEKRNKLTKDLTIGETKRLEIARALATGPKMLLLDEVMAGLTLVEVDEIIQLIFELRDSRGITFMLIEHVMRAVMSLSDKVVVLQHGVKIAEGTPAEVAANEKVIEAYLGEDENIA